VQPSRTPLPIIQDSDKLSPNLTKADCLLYKFIYERLISPVHATSQCTYKSNKIKICVNEMTVNDSEMSVS